MTMTFYIVTSLFYMPKIFEDDEDKDDDNAN